MTKWRLYKTDKSFYKKTPSLIYIRKNIRGENEFLSLRRHPDINQRVYFLELDTKSVGKTLKVFSSYKTGVKILKRFVK